MKWGEWELTRIPLNGVMIYLIESFTLTNKMTQSILNFDSSRDLSQDRIKIYAFIYDEEWLSGIFINWI